MGMRQAVLGSINLLKLEAARRVEGMLCNLTVVAANQCQPRAAPREWRFRVRFCPTDASHWSITIRHREQPMAEKLGQNQGCMAQDAESALGSRDGLLQRESNHRCTILRRTGLYLVHCRHIISSALHNALGHGFSGDKYKR